MNNLLIMKINQKDSLIWFNKGKLLSQLGSFELALDFFDRAIIIQENFYEAWSEKGVILEKLNRFEEAEICFNNSLGAFCGVVNWEMEEDCY